MSALPSAQETVAIIARVEHETKQALVEQAREHGRSISGELRVLIREGLAAKEHSEERPA